MQYISSPGDVARIINERGFLPFFANEISDFSLEEITPQHLWFPNDKDLDDRYGVWDWKASIIIEGDCAYGKFCLGKACFISMEWFPDFVNYRRTTHLLTPTEQTMLSLIREKKTLLSRELKRLCGYTTPHRQRIANPIARLANNENAAEQKIKPKRENFDTAITRLQMTGNILTADFEYAYDRQGRRYGWSVARYCTPEDFFGQERMTINRTPEESRARLIDHLTQTLPQASHEQIMKIVG